MTQPPVPDLEAIRAELGEIEARKGDRAYRGDVAWHTSMWATVGRHVPVLVAEVERLRALVDRDMLREQRDQARAEKGELLRLVAEMLSDPVDNAALVRWHQEYRRLST